MQGTESAVLLVVLFPVSQGLMIAKIPGGRRAIPVQTGGAGVIENDFHDRKDLTPNVCAVYVEEHCRCQGIAGKLLEFSGTPHLA